MNARIKKIRKDRKMTQKEFADFLGVPVFNISNYEIQRRTPTASTIQLICNKCGVNETWLRTGEGEMYAPDDKEQRIAKIVASLYGEDMSSYRFKLQELIAQLTDEQIELCIDMAKKLTQ